MHKIELLAPAGDLEKLKIAVEYGADAVYFGGSAFSLRVASKNFSEEEIYEGAEYAHRHNVKLYQTINAFAHNRDIEPLNNYLDTVAKLPLDGIIASDPGVISMLKEKAPHIPIHLSTQANTTNYRTANFWYGQGIRRVVLARELSLSEIREIRENVPDDMELEAFVHGAMCISYSGRCLLSNFMTGRDANQGACTHPCRWKYRLEEEQRPGEYYPVEEDSRGTYIFNSKDLCMIEHIPELAQAGVTSLKIEGRVKSVYYVATIIGAYRRALDAYMENPDGWECRQEWVDELTKVSHRQFTTGFFFGSQDSSMQNYDTSQYSRNYTFIGVVSGYDENTGYAEIQQRNKVSVGDEVEIFGPETPAFHQTVREILNEKGESVDSAPHPKQVIRIPVDQPVKANFLLRRRD